MRRIWALLGAAVWVSASGAYAEVQKCTPQQITSADDGYSAPTAPGGGRAFRRSTYEAHPSFHLDPVVYDHPIQGAPHGAVAVVITTEGRVECLDTQHGWSMETLALTPYRRALLNTIENWRFNPVLVDGAPVRAIVRVVIPETVDFHFHEDMPKAPLSQMSVSLERGICGLGNCPTYKVTVRGDGTVDYDARSGADVRGPHSWHIPPADAAALFDRLRTNDIWSAAGTWYALITDTPTQTITLTVGTESRQIVDHVGQTVGMPAPVVPAETDIDATSLANDVVHLTPRGLALLDDEKFDFKSGEGADLLARVSMDRDTSEDMALALLDRGASPDGGKAEWPARADDTHVFFHQVLSRNWTQVIVWLTAHGFAAQLDANRPKR